MVTVVLTGASSGIAHAAAGAFMARAGCVVPAARRIGGPDATRS
jgi:NADP-dependent 3-hydroxy acid dehydrogenase YdfG